ncbi:MAG TPA: ABC-ATPase domain-containing protein [Kiritimatiellia bacterium]|nr:ABC-ATPase domain-containing protein [Kiritimatiellia bacterium]HNS81356.1 ABC-ATPase domain-containing protein [Kiritimatiellia bacterium]HPA78474.1 ABC-ATPase domain-containing protein [Kiritimatiellia bacterium]
MRDKKEFHAILTQISGGLFREYGRLAGDFDFNRYVLKIHFVQDAAEDGPTLFVVRVPQFISEFPERLFSSAVRRTALEDLLVRKISESIEGMAHFNSSGTARRRFQIARLGQKILPRSSVIVTDEYVEARLYASLPREGEVIPGDAVLELFFEDLPAIVNTALIYCNLDRDEVEHTVGLMEDTDVIRQMLPTQGMVGFVGDGLLLSRKPGTDLPDFTRNTSLKVDVSARLEVEVPHLSKVYGAGIPAGITVIMGDAYSGRIEIMQALASGIYNHIAGDGRELAITVPDAVEIRSEPGRSIAQVNVSAFVSGHACGCAPEACSTNSADAFLSQAAATVEALQAGARVLLFDEATSCSAFLSSDQRLTALLGARSGIIPLAARARQLADDLGVSLVIGGETCVAEFIPIADRVLRVNRNVISDITEEARKATVAQPPPRAAAIDVAALAEQQRWIVPSSIDPTLGREDSYICAPNVHTLCFGRSTIDLSAVSQLADIQQTETIAHILYYAKLRYMDESHPLREILDLVDRDLSTEGLECLARELRGDLARPRRYEIAAALNRLSTLRVQNPTD